MKKIIALLLFSLQIFFLSSCSKDGVTESGKETIQTFGSATFRIDKVNAPSNVSVVTAYLSRPDCDTLVKSLNIADSSALAEMLFENIKTGLWHLKVVAKSSTEQILYSGETDLIVEDSKTTDVYLTLVPTPTGLGNVFISIKWGTAVWTDYEGNPVFTGDDAYNNPIGGVSSAKVLYDGGKYKMWYMHTYESGRADINYAESVDGFHWHNTLQKAVLSAGAPGSWDGYMVGTGAIIKEDGVFKMYYVGCRSYDSDQNVGLATSTDGINWQKNDKPVLYHSSDESKITGTAVVKKDGLYYMYFTSGFSSGLYKIGVAVSQDGISWEKRTEPVVVPSEVWESSGIVYPTVVYNGTKFIMIYKNLNRTAFGMASSTDGIHWTKDTGNPIFESRNTAKHWTGSINYPWLLLCNNQYRVYYSGAANGEFSLGVLTKPVI